METERAEGTRASTCPASLAMSFPQGANHRRVVNHPRRRTGFNGLGPGLGQCLKTRAQPPSADPHARWCGRGPGVIRAPIPMYARHGRELVGCKSPVRKRESKEGSIPNVTPIDKVLGEGNCGEATNRGKEACEPSTGVATGSVHAKAARLRTETPCRPRETLRRVADGQRSRSRQTPTVDGELVQRKFTLLFGEICARTRE